MASLIKGESQDRLIDAAGLRAMLEGCRHEIDTVRHDAAFGDDGRVGGVATGLELRLENIAERLERATRPGSICRFRRCGSFFARFRVHVRA